LNFLADTNVLLWVLLNDSTLSNNAREVLGRDDSTTYVSVVSLWEITVKHSIGKLKLPGPASEWLIPAVEQSNIEILPLAPQHATGVSGLAWHHRDPFDRLIIVQAQMEKMTVLTRDRHFHLYGVDVIDA